MPLPIEQSQEAFQNLQRTFKEIDEKFTEQVQPEAYKALSKVAEEQLEAWKKEVSEKQSSIDAELVKTKPVNKKSELDSEKIAVLNYHAKTIRSRVAAATEDQFKSVVEDFAKHPDEMVRQAFVDSIHDIFSTAQELFPGSVQTKVITLDPWDKPIQTVDVPKESAMLSKLRELQREAVDSLKSPEQKQFELDSAEAESKKMSLMVSYIAAEKNMKDFKGKVDIKNWGERPEVKSAWN